MGRMLFEFFEFFAVIKRDKRVVLIEGLKGFYRFDGICINDLIPNPGLPLLFGIFLMFS